MKPPDRIRAAIDGKALPEAEIPPMAREIVEVANAVVRILLPMRGRSPVVAIDAWAAAGESMRQCMIDNYKGDLGADEAAATFSIEAFQQRFGQIARTSQVLQKGRHESTDDSAPGLG